MASPTLPWVDLALARNGHPSCERIVSAGRRARRRKSWRALADEVGAKSDGTVSAEWLRRMFGYIDAEVDAEIEAELAAELAKASA